MDDKRTAAERLGAVEGADAAALGLTGVPEPAPPAEMDAGERLVPGAVDEARGAARKPWQTSLAAESSQAGVANDPPDAQPPLYPNEATTRAEDETDPH